MPEQDGNRTYTSGVDDGVNALVRDRAESSHDEMAARTRQRQGGEYGEPDGCSKVCEDHVELEFVCRKSESMRSDSRKDSGYWRHQQ